MMSEGTVVPWSLWIEREARPPRRWGNLAIGLALGVLLGSAAVAADRIYDASQPEKVVVVPQPEVREIPLEWRQQFPRAPYERMFRSRR